MLCSDVTFQIILQHLVDARFPISDVITLRTNVRIMSGLVIGTDSNVQVMYVCVDI